ncbi:MAG: hypothetical protein WDM96_03470 [Lacunisphaera sp.]
MSSPRPVAAHATDEALAHGKHLGLQHLLDELGARAQFHLLDVGNRPVRRKQSLDRHAAHQVVGTLLENAGAQRTRAEDRGMDDALEQLVARSRSPTASTIVCM